MTLGTPGRLYCGLVGVVALMAGGFVQAAPAQAHPFGDPQTVAIALDREHPQVVQVRWKVGGLDDLTLLGVALGLVPQDRVMLDGAVFFQDSDAAAISASGKFNEYLLKQITVDSGGQACAGSVQPPSDLAKTGVAIEYTCPETVGAASVTVRMLTDLNPAYRTLATGPNGERAVYAADQVSHDWVLDSTQATASTTHAGRSAVVQIAAVVGGVVLVAAALLGFRRVSRRRRAGQSAVPEAQGSRAAV
ncbi:hypothetical protein ACFPJ1_25825 [Kribbella qitaiheensis]|uniref:hypothetical protein n=1 Tax=Kribbella qitaiheensis TaxID=1544730 RepID=UPI00361C9956